VGRAIRAWCAAFVRYHRGLGRMPLVWKPWLTCLLAANMIVPLFYLTRFEALVVFGCALVNGAIFVTVTAFTGFSRLLGVGHIPWMVLVPFLATRLAHVPADDAYGWWLRIVMVLDFISIFLDAANVVRYLAGERGEMVAGLEPPRPGL
jgi:hypothetical protein